MILLLPVPILCRSNHCSRNVMGRAECRRLSSQADQSHRIDIMIGSHRVLPNPNPVCMPSPTFRNSRYILSRAPPTAPRTMASAHSDTDLQNAKESLKFRQHLYGCLRSDWVRTCRIANVHSRSHNELDNADNDMSRHIGTYLGVCCSPFHCDLGRERTLVALCMAPLSRWCCSWIRKETDGKD